MNCLLVVLAVILVPCAMMFLLALACWMATGKHPENHNWPDTGF